MSTPTPYSTKVSIQLPNDRALREKLGESYKSSETLNVVKMFAGTEDMFDGTIALIKAVFTAKDIDPKLRQMIILRSAKLLNSPYEWQANVPMSINNGLTQEEIGAAASDGDVTGVQPDYILVCRATDELSRSATLTDDTLTNVIARFGDVGARKIVLIISWFNLLARFLNGCRVPMEATDKIGSKTAPLG